MKKMKITYLFLSNLCYNHTMLKETTINKDIWVIGDVHGDLKQLKSLISKIEEKDKNPIICFVGDLINRGEESIEVMEYIIKNGWYAVKGNHEEMMIQKSMKDMWLNSDGYSTMIRYRKEKKFFKAHRKYLKTLPVVIKFMIKNQKPLFVSHSGYDIDKTEINDYDIMWNKRGKYPISEKGVNIFGHIVTHKDKAFLSKSHICIDTGGYKKKSENIGFLTAINYPSLERVYS